MTINPEAVMTPGPPCSSCGDPIEGYYAVMLCNFCLEENLPVTHCEVCGSTDTPYMTRLRDGRWKNDAGDLLPARYFCDEHALSADELGVGG